MSWVWKTLPHWKIPFLCWDNRFSRFSKKGSTLFYLCAGASSAHGVSIFGLYAPIYPPEILSLKIATFWAKNRFSKSWSMYVIRHMSDTTVSWQVLMLTCKYWSQSTPFYTTYINLIIKWYTYINFYLIFFFAFLFFSFLLFE